MGTWSASIWGNDTACDLRCEYGIAFTEYAPDVAVEKLDMLVKTWFDERDYEEWDNYLFSLSSYMQRHGIYVESVVQKALGRIDALCAQPKEIGKARVKVLQKLKEDLLLPVLPAKKIHLKLNLKPLFEIGDVLTVKIDPTLPPGQIAFQQNIPTQLTHYVLLQKVQDDISWTSKVCPKYKDIWPIFSLYDYLSPIPPTMDDWKRARIKWYFTSDGTMHSYKKRELIMLGHEKPYLSPYIPLNDGVYCEMLPFSAKVDYNIRKRIM